LGIKDLSEKKAELENRRLQLRRRYEELRARLRSSSDEIEAYKLQAEMLDVGRALGEVEEGIRELEARLRSFGPSDFGRRHESVILSGCLTLERHLKELRDTLLKGNPPESAGIAGKALPLPEEESEYAKRMLDELQAEVEALKERFGQRLIDETPSLSLTYMWSSVLLGKMEGVVESLKPSSLERKYGEMPLEYREFLEKKLPRIQERIAELRRRYTTAKA
jgi:hypothetical protein